MKEDLLIPWLKDYKINRCNEKPNKWFNWARSRVGFEWFMVSTRASVNLSFRVDPREATRILTLMPWKHHMKHWCIVNFRMANQIFLSLSLAAVLQPALADTDSLTIKIKIPLQEGYKKGTISLNVRSHPDPNPRSLSRAITEKREQVVSFEKVPMPLKNEPYLYVYGTLTGQSQDTIAYVPVTIIDLRKYPRWDLLDYTVTIVSDKRKALLSSFPLSPTIGQSLKEFPLDAALIATKLLMLAKWIDAEDEWSRITGDYLHELPRIFQDDPTRIAIALLYLDEYIEIANRRDYDRFYVSFLLALKKLGLGGTKVSPSQTLDDKIFSGLNKIFATRLLDTYDLSSNAVRELRQRSLNERRAECINLSDFLLNAIDGALAEKKIQDSAKGDILSFLQAVTVCASEYYVDSVENTSRIDVKGTTAYLWGLRETKDFVRHFMQLCANVESLGWLPRFPRGADAARVREISKYYWNFGMTRKASGDGDI